MRTRSRYSRYNTVSANSKVSRLDNAVSVMKGLDRESKIRANLGGIMTDEESCESLLRNIKNVREKEALIKDYIYSSGIDTALERKGFRVLSITVSNLRVTSLSAKISLETKARSIWSPNGRMIWHELQDSQEDENLALSLVNECYKILSKFGATAELASNFGFEANSRGNLNITIVVNLPI